MKTLEEYMNLPYRVEITPDVEEGGYVASYPDLPGCITTGATMEQVLRNASDAKMLWLETAIKDGVKINKPEEVSNYSGQFKLRLPKSLHQSLAMHAKKEGISMNQYCLYLLTKNDSVSTNH